MNLALLSLSTFYVKSIDGNQLAASYTFIGIVLLQFLGLVIIRIIAKLKEKKYGSFFQRLYTYGQNVNEDINNVRDDEGLESEPVPFTDWTDINYRDCDEL